MTGNPPNTIDLTPLKRSAIVYDVVYVPLETDLLKRAREAGHRVADGLSMLLYQAVPGFTHWFGVAPKVMPEQRAIWKPTSDRRVVAEGSQVSDSVGVVAGSLESSREGGDAETSSSQFYGVFCSFSSVRCSSSVSPVRSAWASRPRPNSSVRPACRCMIPTRWCTGSTRARRSGRSKRRFPAPWSTARSIAQTLREAGRQSGCDPPARSDRASAGARGIVAFLQDQAARGARTVVLDIPLLFETGGEKGVDAVVVVSAPAEVQRARVLSRPGITAARLDALLARQMPDAEKRARAHFVVDPSRSFDSARAQVHGILRAVAACRGGESGRPGPAEAAPVLRHRRTTACARSCSTPRPPASTPTRATGWSRSAVSSW